MKHLLLLLLVSGSAMAHQLTPTYPKLKNSYVEGVLETKVQLWNARADVEYFKIEVTDKDWNPVPFITNEEILYLNYLDRQDIEIFLPGDTSAVYICTRSLLQKGNAQKSIISSKVCSKIK